MLNFNIDKVKKVNDELMKYRVFKALKVNYETSINSKDIYETLWSNQISKTNLKYLQKVFLAWKGISLKNTIEIKGKLNLLGERNYFKLADLVFTSWAHTIKRMKLMRKLDSEYGNKVISR